jgi:hypothetical protein
MRMRSASDLIIPTKNRAGRLLIGLTMIVSDAARCRGCERMRYPAWLRLDDGGYDARTGVELNLDLCPLRI